MRKILGEVYTLSYRELEILADLSGKDSLFGFQIEDVETIEKEEVIQLIYQMAKKGILIIEKDRVQINPSYQIWVRNMYDAKYIMVITSTDKTLPQKCCYIGKNILVSEVMKTRKNRIRMESFTMPLFWEMLISEGYLPEVLTEDQKLLDDLEQENLEKLENYHNLMDKEVEDIQAQYNAMTIFEIFDMKQNERLAVIEIVEDGYLYQVQVETLKKKKKFFYSLERFKTEVMRREEMKK